MQTIEVAERLASKRLDKYRDLLDEDPETLWYERMHVIVDGFIPLDDASDILTACAQIADEATSTLEARRQQDEPKGQYVDTTVEWIDVIHVCLAALNWSRDNREGVVVEHARELLLRCGALADWWTQQLEASGD